MTSIYLVRHGKTEWNLEGRYQGAHGDSPLLAQSYREIDLLAKSLRGVKFAHAFASPIKRARVTAIKLVEQLWPKPPLTLDNRLAEFDLGQWEGMKFTDVERKWPEEQDAFHHHADQFHEDVVGAESFQHVINRVGGAIKEFCRLYPTGNILVVSHGAALNATINGLLGVSLTHLKDRGGLSNTSTTILTSNDAEHFDLVKWNDTKYLHKTKVDPTDTI